MALAAATTLSIGGPPMVNLMPRAEIDRRDRSRLLRQWLAAVVVAIAIVAVVAVAAFGVNLAAQQRLASENNRTTGLLSDLAALTPVKQTLAVEKDLSEFRTEAMATDLPWTTFLSTVQAALPADVAISDFSLAPGSDPQGDDPTAEVGILGTLHLTSTVPQDVVTIIRALRGAPGVLDADGWSVTSGADAVASEPGEPAPTATTYTYEIRLKADQSLYSGKYASEEAEVAK